MDSTRLRATVCALNMAAGAAAQMKSRRLTLDLGRNDTLVETLPWSKRYHHKINAGPSGGRASMRFAILLIPTYVFAANIPADISGVRPGVITVAATAASLAVRWPDEASRT